MLHAYPGIRHHNVPQYGCLHHLLAGQATQCPKAPVLVTAGYTPLTYEGLWRHSNDVVRRLRALGIGCKDRVALVLSNGPEMAVAFLAVAAGAICAPLNPASSPNEFAMYLAELDAKALIVQAGTDSPARAVAHTCGMNIIELLPLSTAEAGLFTLAGEEQPYVGRHGFSQPDDVALVLPTSGTTSRPKMVPLTHTNICTAAHNMHITLALGESDRCINVLPLFHAHALLAALLTSLVAGASVICNPSVTVPAFFAAMAEFRPTWYTAVPTVHQAILASAAQYHEIIADCPLRFIRSASAPLPSSVLTELEEVFKAPVLETYGMTETAAQITSNPLPPRVRKPGSVGIAAGPTVAIMSADGTMLPAGEIGEIVVRGPTVFQGYCNDPAANRNAFVHDWFRTGDQGFLDSDGYLFITGRLSEVINRGGEKIAPQEVDNVLMEHPAVAQALTFAIPHVRLGEDVAAAVVLRQDAAATVQEIRQFAATRLADFKLPRHIAFVKELPKSPTGKLQRLSLAAKLGLMVPGQTQPLLHADPRAPRTLMEELLAGLWTEVLKLERVGIHDDFFQVGGDSLLAMQLMARVRETICIELSFSNLFETPTVAGMAKVIESARQAVLSPQAKPLQPVPRDSVSPLSYAQQRLWFLEQLEPSRAVYNLPLAWRFSGDLSVPALEQSLSAMVRRHEILRTTFTSVDGHPVQVIAPALALPLPVVDLQSLPATVREVTVEHLAAEEAQRPFDWTCGPLVRATLLRLSAEDHVLLLTLHHIIFDGWSAEIFWRELATLYTAICLGQSLPLPALPLQYADFVIWQRQWLQGDILAAQLAYWQQQLGGTLSVLQLPTDRPRPPIQTFRGAHQTLLLPLSLTAALKALSRQEGVTLFMTLLAAFLTILHRYTGQEDLVVGTPVAGRTRVETEGLIGCFVNTLVLRTDLGGHPSFQELLRRVREVALGAYDHQELPFEKLVEVLQPERDLSRNPLFQVMIAFQPTLPLVQAWPSLTVHPVALASGPAKFELSLVLQDTAQGLMGMLEYNTDLFDVSTITRMLGHFQTLLEGITAHPDQCLAALPLLTAAERQQLVTDWQNTPGASLQDVCLHQLFEAQVERVPDTTAVICEAQQLTYWELNQRANQLAHYLSTLGVGPEVLVGLCVERSLEMVVGILGILKAGGAYVPLDPTYPSERLAFMLADARISVLVMQQKFAAKLPLYRVQWVYLDTDGERMAAQYAENPVSGVTPENLAYVMYTSGSTGIPKGVMNEHRQVVAFLHGFEHVAPGELPTAGTGICPFSFDVSVWEYFSILGFGGTLHVLTAEAVMDPARLACYLMDHRVTSVYLPPALLPDIANWLERRHAELALKRLLVGVEPIKQDVLQRFRDLAEHLHIVNGYGPTETTICATLFAFHTAMEPNRRTPIGTGICGYEVYLVDTNLQPVPIGVSGELYIGGVGLARGYLNHPEFTAERFIPHPFDPASGARLYKTGDLGRYLPDGNLEFLGRLDQQVKIRGYRVELEEIEGVLRQHPAVREAMVLAREDEHLGDKRLVAYLVTNQAPAPAPLDLRGFLQQKLPAYMVPSVYMVLETLPLTPNGKVDRQALPIPDMRRATDTTSFVAPHTATESTLAGIWANVLGLERVGRHDNFFVLGGDSILGMRIIAKANQVGLRLAPKQLFQYQTIAELATVASTIPAIPAEQGLVLGPVPLTPIQHWFFEQALPDVPLWSQAMLLEVRQSLDVAVLERAVQYLLVHHDMLRARFRRTGSGWQQSLSEAAPAPLCTHVDLSGLSEAQQDEACAAMTTALQTNCKLEEGPLIRVTLCELGPHSPARLLVVIHHLVVDNVSWRIVLEDLHMACAQLRAGQALQLPPKTTSFQYWAEQLTAYAQSPVLQQEMPYWLAAPRTRSARLPVDDPEGTNTLASAYTVSASLSHEETHALLRDVPQAYETHMNDVLLTALVQTFTRWAGASAFLIDLEGHGREEIGDGIDVSRTVGWFTTLFPVLLQLEPAAKPGEALKAVKEQVRRVPHRGLGYGVLRYLSQDVAVTAQLRDLPPAEVCFNYLGQFDQVLPKSGLFGRVQSVSRLQSSPTGSRRYLLEVNGRIAEGQLHLEWTYSSHVHRHTTVAGLAQDYMEALRTLIGHCQSPEAGGYTPSDFPHMRFDQQELDELLTALDEVAEGT